MGFVRLALGVLLALPLFLLAALCAGAAVAAHFGRTSLQWDLLAHFAPLWLAGALAGALGGLFFRGYARALIVSMGAVGVAAAGLLMAPEYLRDTGPRAGPDAPGQLKLIQFNIWHDSDGFERSVDWLIAQDPDIVVIEESRPEVRRMIAERTDWHATCAECETVIYSRAAPIRQGSPRVPGAPGPLTRAIFEDARGRYTVIGVHYAWPTDPQDQQPQERRLARVLGETDRARTIVAGDFNSAPWSFSRRRWDAEFGVIRRDRALFSWPALQYKRLPWLGIFPFLPIDHVYAGSDWATVKVERGPRLGSDHYPVLVTLAPVARR
ncbi:endonuclease/exonuclease/phosphatase family protein [Phenylobacterium sp.]|uniref:endonuclease/exonuclease/phosphatase family protein n=1 Tax=Phenylobacterium sp. TaxID=1871053 RepID=UPI002FE3C579